MRIEKIKVGKHEYICPGKILTKSTNFFSFLFFIQVPSLWTSGSPMSFHLFSDFFLGKMYLPTFKCNFYNFKFHSEIDSDKICPDLEEIKNKTLTTKYPVQASRNESCVMMLLSNFAQPEWVTIDCNSSLLLNIFCEVVLHSKPDVFINLTNLTVHCISDGILVNSSCLYLSWNECGTLTDVCRIQKHRRCLTIQSLKHLVFLVESTTAVFPPLLAVYTSNTSFALKLFSLKYDRWEKKRQELVLHTDAKGYIVMVSRLKVKQIQGNVFSCKKGSFVSLSLVCDGKVNCPNDKSDESGCVCYGHRKHKDLYNCKEVVLRNKSKICGPLYFVNKFGNCDMHLSENTAQLATVHKENCQAQQQNLLHLTTVAQEVLSTSKIDSEKLSCHDGSSVQYITSQICTFKLSRTNQLVPCKNGGHLRNCLSYSCNKLFKCFESYCIHWSYLCDDKWDCPFGEDEKTTTVCETMESCAGMYKCSGSPTCEHIGSVCDEKEDCPLGEDEHLCEIDSFLCPKNCHCLALIIRCEDTEGIPQGIQMAHLSFHFVNCKLSFLDEFHIYFHKAILFDLTMNNISTICGVHLPPKLKKFILSSNAVLEIRTLCLVPSSMHILHMDHNNISQIEANCFDPLKCLNELDLSDNPLTQLPSSTFSKQFPIERLKMNNIKLVTADANVFSESRIAIISATDYQICCLAPPKSICTVEIPWHVSCSYLLPSNSLRVSYKTVSVCNFLFNFISVLLHISKEGVFQSAFIIIVIFINFTEVLYGIYLSIIWVTDTINSGLFFLKEEKWRSHPLCFALFGLVIWYVFLCQCVLLIMSLVRLMVVKYPIDSRFKSTHFVKKLLICAVSCSSFPGLLLAIISKLTIEKLPMSLCLPFVDPHGTKTTIIVLTWCAVITQLITSLVMLMIHVLLILNLKQSEKEVVKSQPKQSQGKWFLLTQLITIVSTNILCWLPANGVFLSAMFLEKYPIEMVTWTSVVGLSVNSVGNPIIFICVWARQWAKERKKKEMVLNGR